MAHLSVGEIAPLFALATQNRGNFDLGADDIAGQFIMLVFCRGALRHSAGTLRRINERFEDLRRDGVVVAAVCREDIPELDKLARELSLGIDLLADSESKVLAGYGLAEAPPDGPGEPVTVLLGPNRHVLAEISSGDHAEAVIAAAAAYRAREERPGLGCQPPILMVPDVLTPDDCRQLIERYNRPDVPVVNLSDLDREDFVVEGDVKARVADYDREDRIDYFIASADIKNLVAGRLQSRLLPEMQKAFHFRVSNFEALRIAGYGGARGGRSHGHRDNSRPEVAHRQFSVSINLNAEEFEGGEVVFPEYSSRGYRAQSGAALVFSCSLLHEALGVTKGQRYVLLTFLNGPR